MHKLQGFFTGQFKTLYYGFGVNYFLHFRFDFSKIIQNGASCAAVAAKISEGLARSAVAAKVNGELCDLSHTLNDGDMLEIVTLKEREGAQLAPFSASITFPSFNTTFIYISSE